MEQSSNFNPNFNSLVNVTLSTEQTSTSTLAENEKEIPLVTLTEALNDVRAQFRRGEFYFKEPRWVGAFFRVNKETEELDRLAKRVKKDFDVG